MKRFFLNALIVLLIITSGLCITWGVRHRFYYGNNSVYDTTQMGEVNAIVLSESKVKVSFSDVILSKHQETRKLIVSQQEAKVSAEISANLSTKLDFDATKKSQKVDYTGTGYFVVDLDKISKEDLIDDEEHKILTIKIKHSYLETVIIDPEKIEISGTNKGLLAFGKLRLTVNDFNAIEKDIQKKLTDKFNTAKNAQVADDIALRMVREVYEPIVKIVDKDYQVNVEFK